ncbi:MAG: flagellar type III secretion system pore protein FliP [Candidatus Saganbacteria bacterium]|nr:flagellar type III secretion system pore protein FliP [Candidatus Saganbacteria bacterium]
MRKISLWSGALLIFLSQAAFAATPLNANINFNSLVSSPQFSNSLQLLISLSAISLVPFFLISVTSFLRFIIVLSLVRTGIGTQQVPPSSVIVALSLFMTVFVMSPVWQEVNATAFTPYNEGKLSQAKAIEIGMQPLRKFMFKQTREKDLALFVEFSKIPRPKSMEEIPTYVLIPAFMISELKTSFQIGFLILIPFIIVDLVVSNILLSLGMFMLSPVMVSLPFKILLFVLVDGWGLIIRGLMISFR